MKGIVVYDSGFGNTRAIAETMGQALDGRAEVQVVHVDHVEERQLVDVDLLIVGSPTQRFSPTAPINDFLNGISPRALRGVKVAAFDTRFAEKEIGKNRVLAFFVRIFGYAAKPIAEKLVKKGGRLALPPEGFYVGGMEGLLLEGELERVVQWINKIFERAEAP
ncbi:MAG: flavodoxin domain-containing protein [Anaerolineales bacterium]